MQLHPVIDVASNGQLVVMPLESNGEIGAAVHKLEQFFRVEEGTGDEVLDGVRLAIRAGSAVLVDAPELLIALTPEQRRANGVDVPVGAVLDANKQGRVAVTNITGRDGAGKRIDVRTTVLWNNFTLTGLGDSESARHSEVFPLPR